MQMQKKTAFVIIDMQIGLLAECAQERETLDHINVVLGRARDNSIPVIYVQHDGPKGDSLEPGTPTWHIHPDIEPRANEPVVRKASPDAFFETTLQQELEARGVQHLVVAGGQTEFCIDTSVRRAASCGYDVTLVADAHTTSDRERWPATQIIALHNETLDGFWAGERRVRVKPADEISF
jgi:nicotinamidase-related amidase